MRISLKKFQLSTQITFGGVNIDPSLDGTLVFSSHRTMLEEVRNLKKLTNKKELQSFLGVAATFHHWNTNFSKYSEKMSKLNSKGVHFKGKEQWTLDLEEEFHKLKKEICEVLTRNHST